MFRILDIIGFSLERIRQHFMLVFWVLLGITIAVTLSLSLPLYVDSVYSGILESQLVFNFSRFFVENHALHRLFIPRYPP